MPEKKQVNLSDIETIIRDLRGFSFRSVKPLNAANTMLECYLANNTHNPWPGDLDGIIIYDHQPKLILEFKTHNLNTPIEQERIGKYGQEDWRRFKVLYTIQKQLSGIPILFVVWGPNHDQVKIDRISE